MRIRPICIYCLLLGLMTGCSRSGDQAPPLAPDTAVRVHWIGMDQFKNDKRASGLMQFLRVPENAEFMSVFLQKLADSAGRWLPGAVDGQSNGAAALLAPVLTDAVNHECFFELSTRPNSAAAMVFAIRLPYERADSWQKNLGDAWQTLAGVKRVETGKDVYGWQLTPTKDARVVQVSRVREWVVVGVTTAADGLVERTSDRIRREQTPFLEEGTNYWLHADVDLGALAAGGDRSSTGRDSVLPRITTRLIGDGINLRIGGEIIFPELTPMAVPVWRINTNRIIGPIVGFTAVRGLKSWLETNPSWTNLHLGPPPDQCCVWAPDGVPLQVIATAPVEETTNCMRETISLLTGRCNPWLSAHGKGSFEVSPFGDGAIWIGLPNIAPMIRIGSEGNVILGSLLPNARSGTNTINNLYYHRTLVDCLHDIASDPDLLAYDWEITGSRIETFVRVGEVARYALGYPQLPLDSPAVSWLGIARRHLGNCTTRIRRTRAGQIEFERSATIGLSAAELTLAADWIESPRFPCGTYTLSRSEN